jgi:hypothetical protein
LILAGLVFLLDSLGILQGVDAWNLIWPLILIALGGWILWSTVFRRPPDLEHASLSLEGAARARVHLHHGAGRLSLGAGAGPDELVEGEFGGGVELKTGHSNGGQEVRMSVPVQFLPFNWSPGYTLDWNVRFNSGVPLELDLETGAGDMRLDLSELQVKDLRLKTGASHTSLTLPVNAGYTRANINSGVAAVEISIPQGVAARVRTHGGLSDIRVDPGRFPRFGDAYQSPDYEAAENKVDLDVEMGVGSVRVN